MPLEADPHEPLEFLLDLVGSVFLLEGLARVRADGGGGPHAVGAALGPRSAKPCGV